MISLLKLTALLSRLRLLRLRGQCIMVNTTPPIESTSSSSASGVFRMRRLDNAFITSLEVDTIAWTTTWEWPTLLVEWLQMRLSPGWRTISLVRFCSGSNGSNAVWSFLLADGVAYTTDFSANVMEFFDYLINNEDLSSSQYLTTFQAGTEATSGSDTFTMTSYTAVIS
ncbi:hypothetical protein BT96DRAFT_1086229 [Gymnopus androsaceus JB14]|uniref:Uncharacterized protein n=1 Tax=Gymnopus androsaceus JB14 TaxID=1447944 RepID=A0A6A4HXU0_9AGAR|nr:hypothetical protein BT96DRAFT_1086229 [Gymnopus androsaceus JB14]